MSRFTVFRRNNDRQSRVIMDGLIDVLGPLPHAARQSITFDRGTEFTDWPYLQAGLGVQTWFCDPQAPWQKGTVEDTNRRARRWLSRDTDPLSVEDRHLKDVWAHLNATSRKCLGFKTPAAVFRQKLLGQPMKRLPCPSSKSRFSESRAASWPSFRRIVSRRPGQQAPEVEPPCTIRLRRT